MLNESTQLWCPGIDGLSARRHDLAGRAYAIHDDDTNTGLSRHPAPGPQPGSEIGEGNREMTDSPLPPVPVHLAGQPAVAGLVVPWITPQAVEGRYLFGKLTDVAQRRCLQQFRCQICGQRLPDRAVLFARESDLGWMCTPEPATCPPCASYSASACPMISGRMHRYRASQHPVLAGIPMPADDMRRLGAPAEAWHAVWVRHYDVVTHPAKPDTLTASWMRIPPLRVRPVPTST